MYTKVSKNPYGMDKWPGEGYDTTVTNHLSNPTADPVRDDEISLEQAGGIRTVMDVHLSF